MEYLQLLRMVFLFVALYCINGIYNYLSNGNGHDISFLRRRNETHSPGKHGQIKIAISLKSK